MPTQEFLEFRKTLTTVKCLWGEAWGNVVRDTYIVGKTPSGTLIGNTDGYDDWGHTLTPREGRVDGEEYDYIDGGKY